MIKEPNNLRITNNLLLHIAKTSSKVQPTQTQKVVNKVIQISVAGFERQIFVWI